MDLPVIPPIIPEVPHVDLEVPATTSLVHGSSETLLKGDDDVMFMGSKEGDRTQRIPYEAMLQVKQEPFEDALGKSSDLLKGGGTPAATGGEGSGKEKKKLTISLKKA